MITDLGLNWQQVSHPTKEVAFEQEVFRIFPKGRDGKTRPVSIHRTFIHVRDRRWPGQVTFKRYLHQKQWHWKDSRDSKSCSELAVVKELADMCCGGDKEQAKDLIIKAMLS